MKYDIDLDLDSSNSMKLMLDRVKTKSVVLEFGPAAGRMSKYMKNELGCTVYAVELDEAMASRAGEFCEKILVEDAEKLNWLKEFSSIQFDYIIFADVLEHLYDPRRVLESAAGLLKEDGSILLSVPNISHNSIIIELLEDKFSYHPTGLLDETHIRFFTRYTIEELIRDCGLYLRYITASFVVPEETEFKNSYLGLNEDLHLILAKRNLGECYQFVCEAVKKDVLVEQHLDQPSTVHVYYDTGNGYSEQEKLSLPFYNIDQNEIHLDLSGIITDVVGLRVDLCELPIEIKLDRVLINNEDYTSSLVHNGRENGEGVIVFPHFDPQLKVAFLKPVRPKGIDILHGRFNFMESIKTYALKEGEGLINERDLMISHLEQSVEEKDLMISHLEQSVQSWMNVAESMRLGNRLKVVVKRYSPLFLYGFLVFMYRVLRERRSLIAVAPAIDKPSQIEGDYHYTTPNFSSVIAKGVKSFYKKPKISLLLILESENLEELQRSVRSIQAQWYSNWEVCIVGKCVSLGIRNWLGAQEDETRLFVLDANLDEALCSSELEVALKGDFIAFVDSGDELTVDALYEVVNEVNKNKPDIIYSDLDILKQNDNYSAPFFKADFSNDLLLSHNYLNHLLVLSRAVVSSACNDNVQSVYDMVLIAIEQGFKAHHIAKVLYHEKQRGISEIHNKSNIQALRKAITRRGISASILEGKQLGSYRIQYKVIDDPLVSIVIPFKDQPKLLVMCIESILAKTTYRNFEIIGVSNGSTDKKVFREMERLAELDSRVVFHEYNVPFNYSEINNYAVKQFVNGKHIIFLNNDIEVISPSWIESMLEHSQRDEVGAVGAKLYFPDGSIQHAGVIMGKGDWHGLGHGVAGHAYSHIDESDDFCDYRRLLNVVSNYHAVTAACMMVERRLFDAAGGFNEVDLKVAFNDVDFCLRLEAMGKVNVYTPFAELYHHESISRGNDAYDEEKQKRYEKEVNYMLSQYLDVIKNDRYYNKNLSLINERWLKEARE